MGKSIAIILILIAVGIGAFLYTGTQTDVVNTSISEGVNPILDQGKAAPDFDLKDYNDESHTLAQYIGTPLVLNSWAAWCPFCVNELPEFAEVQKEFGDQVIFISINRAESKYIAKQYTDDLGITDEIIFLLDPTDSFYKSLGGFSMPETLIVNADGNIVDHKRGPITQEELKNKLTNLLTN